MTEGNGNRRTGIQRGEENLLVGRLLLLWLMAAVLAGCQNETSRVKSPAAKPAADASVQTAQAGAQEPVELEVKVLSPEITVEKPVLDLGEVGMTAKRTGQFKFTSTGTAPLKILKVQSCCGVTTRGVQAGQEYAPGQSGMLEFDFFGGSSPSPAVVRELVLETNDPDHKLVTLTMKASVVQRIDCDPRLLRLFLKRENAGCPDLTIRSLDGKPFSITGFKSTADTISAAFDPNVKATEIVLKPQVDMEKIGRNLRGQISIDMTHPECSNIRIGFNVLAEFTVNPAHLMVFNLRPEQPMQREIWVLSNYREDFEVESVTSQKGYVKLLDKKKVDNRYQLQIEITPPARQGEDTMATDTIEVKIKDAEPVSIPFRGFYVGN